MGRRWLRVIAAWAALRVVEFAITVPAVLLWLFVYSVLDFWVEDREAFCTRVSICTFKDFSNLLLFATVGAIYFFIVFVYLPVTVVSTLAAQFISPRTMIEINVYVYAVWAALWIVVLWNARIPRENTFLMGAFAGWCFGVSLNYFASRKMGKILFPPVRAPAGRQ